MASGIYTSGNTMLVAKLLIKDWLTMLLTVGILDTIFEKISQDDGVAIYRVGLKLKFESVYALLCYK